VSRHNKLSFTNSWSWVLVSVLVVNRKVLVSVLVLNNWVLVLVLKVQVLVLVLVLGAWVLTTSLITLPLVQFIYLHMFACILVCIVCYNCNHSRLSMWLNKETWWWWWWWWRWYINKYLSDVIGCGWPEDVIIIIGLLKQLTYRNRWIQSDVCM